MTWRHEEVVPLNATGCKPVITSAYPLNSMCFQIVVSFNQSHHLTVLAFSSFSLSYA